MIASAKPSNKTKDKFKTLCRIIYLLGAEDYWCEELNIPSPIRVFHFLYRNIVVVASWAMILSQWSVYFTDQVLTEKQNFDSKLFAVAHPLSLTAALITETKRKKVGELIQRLVINLKEIYNDEDVERKMIAKSQFVLKCYSTMLCMTALMFLVEGLGKVKNGLTFVTLVTGWPYFEDRSMVASFARVAIFIVWFLLFLRMTTVLIVVIPLSICLSYQYMNLSSYFLKLNDIFDEDCSQEEKEIKYEKAFKVGIKQHWETMVCVQQMQKVFSYIYGSQVVIKSTSVMAMLSSMANSERTLSNVATILGMISYSLITLGLLICYAGSTTNEAENLPAAIFRSGWHNCSKKTTARIRPLVVIAMEMSQRPVELKCLGIITLSYSSYVTIVKSCYSGFSVLY